LRFVFFASQEMDRRVPAEGWPGHTVEQLRHDGRKIAHGHDGPVAMR